MAIDGKHRYGSGRARWTRVRERDQLRFDDTLVTQFFCDDDDQQLHERRILPVRRGVGRLADHLPDSTVAASTQAGDDPHTYEDVVLPVAAGPFATSLFDNQANSAPANSAPADRHPANKDQEAAPVAVLAAAQSASPIREPVDDPDVAPAHPGQDRKERITVKGLVQGFLIGAGGSVAVLLILRTFM